MQHRDKRTCAGQQAAPASSLLDVLAIVIDYTSLDAAARAATLCESARKQVTTHVKQRMLDVLPAVVSQTAVQHASTHDRRQQQMQLRPVTWVLRMADNTLPAALASKLITIPRISNTLALLLLRHGVCITYEHFITAARSRVIGLEVWVKQSQNTSSCDGIPTIIQKLCCVPEIAFSLEDVAASNVEAVDMLSVALNNTRFEGAAVLLRMLAPTHQSGAKSADITNKRFQLVQQLQQQPELMKQLLCTALLRHPEQATLMKQLLQLLPVGQLSSPALASIFQYGMDLRANHSLMVLCRDPKAASLGADELVALLHEAAMRFCTCDVLQLLLQLPAVQQIPVEATADLLQAAMQHSKGGSFVLVEYLVKYVPAAAHISSSCAEQLVHALLWQTGGVQSEPLLSCSAVQQLEPDAVLRLLTAALQQGRYDLAHQMLDKLPAAAQLTADAIQQAMEVAVRQDALRRQRGLEVLQDLLRLPAASSLSPSGIRRVAMSVTQQHRPALLSVLCCWPGLDTNLAEQLCWEAVFSYNLDSLKTVVEASAAQQLSCDAVSDLLQHLLNPEYVGKLKQGYHSRLEISTLLLRLPAAKHMAANAAAALLYKAVQQRQHAAVARLCECHAVCGSDCSCVSEQLTATQLEPALKLAVQLNLDHSNPVSLSYMGMLSPEQRIRNPNAIEALTSIPAARQLPVPVLTDLAKTAMQHTLSAGAVVALSNLFAAQQIPRTTFEGVFKQAEQHGYIPVAICLLQQQPMWAELVSQKRLLPLLQTAIQQADEDAACALLAVCRFDELPANDIVQLLDLCVRCAAPDKVMSPICMLRHSADLATETVLELVRTALQHRHHDAARLLAGQLRRADDLSSDGLVQLLLAALQAQQVCFMVVATSPAARCLDAVGFRQVVSAAVQVKRLDAVFIMMTHYSAIAEEIRSSDYIEQLLLSCIRIQRTRVLDLRHLAHMMQTDLADMVQYKFAGKGLGMLFFASGAHVVLNTGACLRLLEAAIAQGDTEVVGLIVEHATAAHDLGQELVVSLLESAIKKRDGYIVQYLCCLPVAKQLSSAAHVELLERAVLYFTLVNQYGSVDEQGLVMQCLLELPGTKHITRPVLDSIIQSAASKQLPAAVMIKLTTMLHPDMCSRFEILCASTDVDMLD